VSIGEATARPLDELREVPKALTVGFRFSGSGIEGDLPAPVHLLADLAEQA
jgi:hypothetical protein